MNKNYNAEFPQTTFGDQDTARGWMKSPSSNTLLSRVDANQLTSLSAMIAYLSTQRGESEFRIERGLSDRFNVPNVKCLPVNQFDNAIRYLADMFSE